MSVLLQAFRSTLQQGVLLDCSWSLGLLLAVSELDEMFLSTFSCFQLMSYQTYYMITRRNIHHLQRETGVLCRLLLHHHGKSIRSKCDVSVTAVVLHCTVKTFFSVHIYIVHSISYICFQQVSLTMKKGWLNKAEQNNLLYIIYCLQMSK